MKSYFTKGAQIDEVVIEYAGKLDKFHGNETFDGRQLEGR